MTAPTNPLTFYFEVTNPTPVNLPFLTFSPKPHPPTSDLLTTDTKSTETIFSSLLFPTNSPFSVTNLLFSSFSSAATPCNSLSKVLIFLNVTTLFFSPPPTTLSATFFFKNTVIPAIVNSPTTALFYAKTALLATSLKAFPTFSRPFSHALPPSNLNLPFSLTVATSPNFELSEDLFSPLLFLFMDPLTTQTTYPRLPSPPISPSLFTIPHTTPSPSFDLLLADRVGFLVVYSRRGGLGSPLPWVLTALPFLAVFFRSF